MSENNDKDHYYSKLEALKSFLLENVDSKQLSAFPESFLYTDESLLRFLRAREYNVEEAAKMAKSTLNWYKECNPHKISAKEIEHHFKQGKNYHNGFDKQGRQVIYMRIRLDTPEDPPGKVKIMTYQMERSIRRMKELSTPPQVVWLADCSEFSMRKHVDLKTAYQLINIVTNHYPERLGLLVCIDAPWLFSSFWNMLKPLLTPSTVQKIIFASGEEKKNLLLELIDEDQLEICYGGKNTFTYNHESYFPVLLEEEKLFLSQLENVINKE